MRVKDYAVPILLSVLTFTSMGGALAQSPLDDGQWTAPFQLPLIAIHSAVLPTGKVLMFSAEHGVPVRKAAEFADDVAVLCRFELLSRSIRRNAGSRPCPHHVITTRAE